MSFLNPSVNHARRRRTYYSNTEPENPVPAGELPTNDVTANKDNDENTPYDVKKKDDVP